MDPSSPSEPDFHSFFRGWLTRLELYLHELLHLLRSPDHQDDSKLRQLICRVMTHYHEYYRAKARVSHWNVFTVLSPPWLSSYERTFLWTAGFKPGLAIHVVKSCGVELSTYQAQRMERLTVETKDEESKIEERLEEQVLTPSMLTVTRSGGRAMNGMLVRGAEKALDRLAEDMEVLVGCADYLREKTVVKVVGILTPVQTARFLAAMTELQLRIRRHGQPRDAEIGGAAALP